tara:strand:+ start:326 stop:985 length:660 start_codon:yes stop_codon:yes gene_type:complete
MRKAGLGLSDFDFSGVNVQSAATGGIGNRAAAAVQGIRSRSPKYGQLGQLGIGIEAQEKSQAMAAEADVKSRQILADASVESAQMQADAQKSAANEASQGAMMGSVFGAIGSIGAGLLSDETTKDNIETIDTALATLRQLRPVTFQYNEEYSSSPERLHHGFTAQEFSKILPDATYFDESTGKLCIDTGDLIGLLVRAVQELETRITHMEAVQALTGVK